MAEDNTETAEVTTDSETTSESTTALGSAAKEPETEKDQDGLGETSQESGSSDTASDSDEKSKDSDEASDGEEGDKESGDEKAVEYKDFKFEEGIVVDDATLDSFRDLAGSLNGGKGLSQDDAQALLDMQTELNAKSVKAQTEQWETIYSEWRGEIAADKELGGKNQDVAMRTAMKAAEHYGDPELVNVLSTNPQFGSNPSLVRFLYRVGKTLTEDQVKSGGRAASVTKSADEILYPQKES